MSGSPGVYSVIQYVPSLARGEGVNMGVLIACPAAGQVVVRMSETNEAVKRRFGAATFDDARLTSAKRALARRLQALPAERNVLEDFISREAGSLVVLPPRPMVVERVETDLEELFAGLVGAYTVRHPRERVPKPHLESFFAPLFTQVPIETDVRVTVPVLGKELRAEYAYRNGALNYIKAQGFGPSERAVLKTAEELAVQGRMLATHPEGATPRRLIVVGQFAHEDMSERVAELLASCSVKFVPAAEVPALVNQIRAEAH